MIRRKLLYFALCVAFALGVLFGRATAPEHVAAQMTARPEATP